MAFLEKGGGTGTGIRFSFPCWCSGLLERNQTGRAKRDKWSRIRFFSVICVDSGLVLEITAFGRCRSSQKITAGNRRFSMKTGCPIEFVPFISSLFLLFYSPFFSHSLLFNLPSPISNFLLLLFCFLSCSSPSSSFSPLLRLHILHLQQLKQ